ncbi:MAG: hypothetical protein ACK5K7_02850 [Bacilli bacterium]
MEIYYFTSSPAIQHIIFYTHIYTNKSVGIKGFVVVLLVELIVPIGYILNRTVSLLLALLWGCIYTAWLFTFVDTPSFIAKSIIFTASTLLILASNAKKQNQIVNSAYLMFSKRKSNQSLFIDEFTGLPNINTFKKYCDIGKKQITPIAIIGIKLTFYNQIIDKIGPTRYINVVNDFTEEFKARYVTIHMVFSISKNFFIIKIPDISEQQLIELTDEIKKYFNENYNISVQIGYMGYNEIVANNISSSDQLIKSIQAIVEVDLNAEYY